MKYLRYLLGSLVAVALLLMIILMAGFHPWIVDVSQAQSVNPREKTTFRCHTLVSTATILTELTGCAIVAGQAYYVTDVIFTSSVISATAADSQMTLKYGTGSACATGTAVFWSAMNLALTTVSTHLQTPISIPRGNALCWIHSPAGTKSVTVLGYREK